MRALAAITFLLVALTSQALAEQPTFSPEDFKAGSEYVELASPPILKEKDDGKIEVISFFWYGCGSCFIIDPDLESWSKKLPDDVRFVRLPLNYQTPLDVHARIFMTLQHLGLGAKANTKVFKIFQEDRAPVNSAEQLPELAKALKVNEKKFTDAYNSPEVDEKMRELDKLLFAYNVPGVPSMVIDGRYMFDLGTAHGPTGFFTLADILIEKRRQARTAQ